MVTTTKRFVICVNNSGYEASLENRKIYVALPDSRAEQFGQLRVIDESGEDYLYSRTAFKNAPQQKPSLLLDGLDWAQIREHYDERKVAHLKLAKLMKSESIHDFVDLLLGISDKSGNYSASEHQLGARIRTGNLRAYDRVWTLAHALRNVGSGFDVPSIIERAAIRYLAISVGSEASCMLSPDKCWVTNIRSIWSHIAFERQSISEANEALKLFRFSDSSSEMTYHNWMTPFHAELPDMLALIELEGANYAATLGIKKGSLRYLWIDAIVSAFYARKHSN